MAESQEKRAKKSSVAKKQQKQLKALNVVEKQLTALEDEIRGMSPHGADDDKVVWRQKSIRNIIALTKMGIKDRVKNDEELLERTELFFTMCEETGQQPLWELYCSSLGYSVETIRLWANGTQTGFSEDTKGILNLARQTIMSIDASAASEGKMQPIVYIFRAKNYYGMKDQTEQITIQQSPLGEMDKESARKLLEGIPEDE